MIQLAELAGYFIGMVSIGFLIAWSATRNPRFNTIWQRGMTLTILVFGTLTVIEYLG